MQILAGGVDQTAVGNPDRAVTISDNGSQGQAATAALDSTQASVSTASSDLPVLNPASHIDPALGIVVVEKYGSDGVVMDQYPTAHMMQQYTLYGLQVEKNS